MSLLLMAIGGIFMAKTAYKHRVPPVVSDDKLRNLDLMREDRRNGISQRQFEKNVRAGRYSLPDIPEGVTIDPDKMEKYKRDLYISPQTAHEWARQGKYTHWYKGELCKTKEEAIEKYGKKWYVYFWELEKMNVRPSDWDFRIMEMDKKYFG